MTGDTEAAWASFPHLDAAGEQLMRDMAGSMETELADLLEPSRTPADVQHFRGAQGSSEGSIILRAGKPGSKINFVLRSWLHAELPFGTLNIASLLAMLTPDTDAPHFLFEFIQTGPHSLVVVLDLLPRTDLVLDTDYLKRVYDDSGLDKVRAQFDKVPGVQPYVSPSLFVRSVVSPTAVLLKFQPPSSSSGDGDGGLHQGGGGGGGVDAFLTDLLHPGAKQVFGTWLDTFRASSGGGQQPAGPERDRLARRDDMIKRQGLEMDLTANLPRLFGQEVTDRVVDAFLEGE